MINPSQNSIINSLTSISRTPTAPIRLIQERLNGVPQRQGSLDRHSIDQSLSLTSRSGEQALHQITQRVSTFVSSDSEIKKKALEAQRIKALPRPPQSKMAQNSQSYDTSFMIALASEARVRVAFQKQIEHKKGKPLPKPPKLEAKTESPPKTQTAQSEPQKDWRSFTSPAVFGNRNLPLPSEPQRSRAASVVSPEEVQKKEAKELKDKENNTKGLLQEIFRTEKTNKQNFEVTTDVYKKLCNRLRDKGEPDRKLEKYLQSIESLSNAHKVFSNLIENLENNTNLSPHEKRQELFKIFDSPEFKIYTTYFAEYSKMSKEFSEDELNNYQSLIKKYEITPDNILVPADLKGIDSKEYFKAKINDFTPTALLAFELKKMGRYGLVAKDLIKHFVPINEHDQKPSNNVQVMINTINEDIRRHSIAMNVQKMSDNLKAISEYGGVDSQRNFVLQQFNLLATLTPERRQSHLVMVMSHPYFKDLIDGYENILNDKNSDKKLKTQIEDIILTANILKEEAGFQDKYKYNAPTNGILEKLVSLKSSIEKRKKAKTAPRRT